MKLRDGTLGLIVVGTLLIGHQARAVVYPDENPVTYPASDDENQDAVSRFGATPEQKNRKTTQVLKPLDPISEASFDHESTRAPASVTETGGRSLASEPVRAPDSVKSKKIVVNHEVRDRAYQEVALIANDDGFYPSTVFLTQGIPVRMYITGASAKSQCFMSDEFGVRRQIRNQKIEEINFVPDQPGTFSFNCPMNGAKGSMVVRELEVSDRVPASHASTPVTQARVQIPQAKPKAQKKSEIQEDDFTPEFRNQ